jgi:hypothetical protein
MYSGLATQGTKAMALSNYLKQMFGSWPVQQWGSLACIAGAHLTIADAHESHVIIWEGGSQSMAAEKETKRKAKPPENILYPGKGQHLCSGNTSSSLQTVHRQAMERNLEVDVNQDIHKKIEISEFSKVRWSSC